MTIGLKKNKKKNKKKKQEKTKTDANEFNKWVNKQETDINNELFKNYFKFQRPSDMLKSLYKANTSQNIELVSLINSRLKDLKIKNWIKN